MSVLEDDLSRLVELRNLVGRLALLVAIKHLLQLCGRLDLRLLEQLTVSVGRINVVVCRKPDLVVIVKHFDVVAFLQEVLGGHLAALADSGDKRV